MSQLMRMSSILLLDVRDGSCQVWALVVVGCSRGCILCVLQKVWWSLSLFVCLLGGASVGRRVAFISPEMMEGPLGRVVCSQL